MRGKGVSDASAVNLYGITPACAGKSVFDVVIDALCKDHPRVCGEKLHIDAFGFLQVGSPPRVRGKD